jgi:hypothetical protein
LVLPVHNAYGVSVPATQHFKQRAAATAASDLDFVANGGRRRHSANVVNCARDKLDDERRSKAGTDRNPQLTTSC